MSGVLEILGVVIGAGGIASPLLSIARVIRRTTKPSAEFQNYLENISSRILRSEKLYIGLCTSLLKPMGIDDEELKQMFGKGGESHANWQDNEFLQSFDSFLGSDKERILDTMKGVLTEYSTLQMRIRKIAKHLDSQLFKNKSGSSEKSIQLSAKDKFRISPELKEKLEQSLRNFSDRLDELRDDVDSFRKRKLEDQERQWHQAIEAFEKAIEKRVDNQEWELLLRKISLAKLGSKHLFKALEHTYSCRCHDLRLNIDFDLVGTINNPEAVTTIVRSSFLIAVLTHNTSSSEDFVAGARSNGLESRQPFQDHHGLEIRSRQMGATRPQNLLRETRQTSRERPVLSSLPVGTLPVQTPNSVSSTLPNLSLSMMGPHGKSANLATQLADFMRPHVPNLPIPPSPPLLAPQTPLALAGGGAQDAEQIPINVPQGIDNLCTLFSQLGSADGVQESVLSFPCPSGNDGFQHRLFDKGNLVRPKTICLPLGDLIPRNDDLMTDDRLRIAYHIASSLLQLHLPSWVTYGWASSDVILMQNVDQTVIEDWLPFSQFFSIIKARTSVMNQPTNQRVLPRLPHITALGILLLEIGQAKLLPSGLDAEQEVDEANKLLRNLRARKLMGTKYYGVVEMCLNWRAKTGMSLDLSQEAVQRKFFDEVVQKLRKLADVF